MLNQVYDWMDERLQLKVTIRNLLEHPVPAHVNFLHCFGGITFTLILLQVVTGMFLALYYVASPEQAFASVEYISKEVVFGKLIRGMHRVGASLAIIMVVLHMLRVYFTGSYKKPREMNWLAGVLLLFVLLGFGFTGYLLPWDQKAYWATAVGTNMAGSVPIIGDFLLKVLRGGTELGSLTLTRFYAVHIWFLPVMLTGLLAMHFYMVRKQGIAGPL